MFVNVTVAWRVVSVSDTGPALTSRSALPHASGTAGSDPVAEGVDGWDVGAGVVGDGSGAELDKGAGPATG
ncbi:hypothetical protein MPSYJ_04840 [Mycolicibacterium psychrotolerans]|uniref:Uncharacterized protein n=1 Tax=Mycolicibacterium psychrotolerans TaxID=216929 RepID=A0A7I7M673_9MYCO|nr:hypothetical protein MPSYJ_04840 [Mycolicibacterium psychrotolerans]